VAQFEGILKVQRYKGLKFYIVLKELFYFFHIWILIKNWSECLLGEVDHLSMEIDKNRFGRSIRIKYTYKTKPKGGVSLIIY
jgi:hypothetical protein